MKPLTGILRAALALAFLAGATTPCPQRSGSALAAGAHGAPGAEPHAMASPTVHHANGVREPRDARKPAATLRAPCPCGCDDASSFVRAGTTLRGAFAPAQHPVTSPSTSRLLIIAQDFEPESFVADIEPVPV